MIDDILKIKPPICPWDIKINKNETKKPINQRINERGNREKLRNDIDKDYKEFMSASGICDEWINKGV